MLKSRVIELGSSESLSIMDVKTGLFESCFYIKSKTEKSSLVTEKAKKHF